MERKDFSNLGEEIKEAVTEAVNSMDFKQLNEDIKKTAKDALEQARAGLEAGRDKYNANQKKKSEQYDLYGKEQTFTKKNRSGEWKQKTADDTAEQVHGKYIAPSYGRKRKVPVLRRNQKHLMRCPSGAISGSLMVIFGTLFGTAFGIAALVIFCTMIATGFSELFQGMFIGFFLSTIVSGVLVYRGNKRKLKVKRFRQYVRILGDRTFCQIEEFAGQMGTDKQFVLRDLRQMLADGVFPQGHLDDQETCLMITDESYQQYRAAQEEYKKRKEQEEAVKAAEQAREWEDKHKSKWKGKRKKAEKDSIYKNEELDQELVNAYQEGKSYLDEISKINKEISESEIAVKISHMEVVIRRIFKQVQAHPEQLEEIRRFMEYYLPTTLKLVTAYSEFDAQPVQGENITRAKCEIKETLDTINEAFERLLDSLFESAALDISTDISVMNTMLAQEGLTGDADSPFSE